MSFIPEVVSAVPVIKRTPAVTRLQHGLSPKLKPQFVRDCSVNCVVLRAISLIPLFGRAHGGLFLRAGA